MDTELNMHLRDNPIPEETVFGGNKWGVETRELTDSPQALAQHYAEEYQKGGLQNSPSSFPSDFFDEKGNPKPGYEDKFFLYDLQRRNNAIRNKYLRGYPGLGGYMPESGEPSSWTGKYSNWANTQNYGGPPNELLRRQLLNRTLQVGLPEKSLVNAQYADQMTKLGGQFRAGGTPMSVASQMGAYGAAGRGMSEGMLGARGKEGISDYMNAIASRNRAMEDESKYALGSAGLRNAVGWQGEALARKFQDIGLDDAAARQRAYLSRAQAYQDWDDRMRAINGSKPGLMDYLGFGLNTAGTVIGLGTKLFSSDIRAKENIQPAQEDTNKLLNSLALTRGGYRYNYKPEYGGQQSYGPMAQDLEKAGPAGANMVGKDASGMRYIDPNEATKGLLNAVGELQRQINEIKGVRSSNDHGKLVKQMRKGGVQAYKDEGLLNAADSFPKTTPQYTPDRESLFKGIKPGESMQLIWNPYTSKWEMATWSKATDNNTKWNEANLEDAYLQEPPSPYLREPMSPAPNGMTPTWAQGEGVEWSPYQYRTPGTKRATMYGNIKGAK